MKIAPATALAIWAIGTVYLVAFVVLERLDDDVGEELVDVIQLSVGLVGVFLYRPVRKWFAAWLARNS